MAQVDSRIALGVQPMDVGASIGRGYQLRDLAAQADARKLDTQLKQQAVQKQKTLGDLYRGALGSDGKIDRAKVTQGVVEAGFGADLPDMQKQWSDADKAEADYFSKNSETIVKQLDYTSKTIGALLQNATERVVGDATRMVAGAGGIVGAGRGLANAGAQTLGAFLSQQPTAQLTSAASSGLAGGAVRESGGSEGEQMLGAVLGGLAGAAVPGAAVPGAVSRVTNAAKNAPGKLADLVNPGRSVPVQQMDAQIKIKLEGSGVDWDAIPEKVRQVVRQDVQQALKVGGDLDGQALQRLVDFRTVGATPTRGTVTLDPVQITKEKNLAKMGANSQNANAQKLVSVESANNKALLDNFGRLGADRGTDTHAMGEQAVDSLQGWLDARKGNVNQLYQAARDSNGRSVSLDGSSFTRQASQLLDENLLGHALPKDVERHLNRIAMGEVPFNVDYAEQLKTVIGKLQRGTSDGSTRMALGMVRQALDDVIPATGVVGSMFWVKQFLAEVAPD